MKTTKTESRHSDGSTIVTERLDYDAIAEVFREEISNYSSRYYGDYSERPTPYKVRLVGEGRKRRVYATPIGNVSVIYLKTEGRTVYCESALDAALHRNNEGK